MENKNTKKLIKIVVVIALFIGITIGLTFAINNSAFRHTEGLVYRTETGECYHSPGCGYLWHSAIPMGYEQAKDSSLRRCSRCGGEPKGTIEVNNYGAAFAIVFLVEIVVGLVGIFIWNKSTESKAPKSVNQNTNVGTTETNNALSMTNPNPTNKPSLPKVDPNRPIAIRKGSLVVHAQWGLGEVTCIDDKYISVWFYSNEFKTHNEAVKRFVYPDAIGTYLEVKEY